MRCVQAVLAIGILPLAAIAAPVHIILPDVVTLESGHAITLYSPPHRDAQATYTEPASDAVISVDQNMLLHALVPSAETDVLPTPAASAYEHSKKLAQVSASSSDSAISRATTTSHMLLLESIPDVSHTRTTEIPIITEFGDVETASVTPLSVVLTITPPKHKSTSTTSSASTSSAPLLSLSSTLSSTSMSSTVSPTSSMSSAVSSSPLSSSTLPSSSLSPAVSSSSSLSSAVSSSSTASTVSPTSSLSSAVSSSSSLSSAVSPSSSLSSTVSSSSSVVSSSSTASLLSSREDIFAWELGSTSLSATPTSTIPSNSGLGGLLSALVSVSPGATHESSAISSSSAHSTSSSAPSFPSTDKATSSSTDKEASPAHTTSASLLSTSSKPSTESMPESSPLTTSSLFAWLSQSLAPTDSNIVSASTKSISSSTSDTLSDNSSSVVSHGWALLRSTDSPSALTLSTTPSNSENTVPTSSTIHSSLTSSSLLGSPSSSSSLTSTTETSIGIAASESNTSMTPLAWTTVDPSSSLQIVGSLAMLYPFTTSIPLLIASPDSMTATTSTNMLSRSITAPTKQADVSSTHFWNNALSSTRVENSVSTVATSTQSVSVTSSLPLADSLVGSTTAGSASSRIAPISGHISSPLTLFSGDMVELIVSHSSTPAATPDISISTTQNLFDLPVTAEHVEIPVSSEPSQLLSKRSLNADASSLTAELLSEAAESARSLLSVMRNIATQSENSLPTRRYDSSLVRAVRDQRIIYPDEEVAAPPPYTGQHVPEVRATVYQLSTYTTTSTFIPECSTATTTTTFTPECSTATTTTTFTPEYSTATTTTTLDHTTTSVITTTTEITTPFSPTTTTTTTVTYTPFERLSPQLLTAIPSIPINVVVTLVAPS